MGTSIFRGSMTKHIHEKDKESNATVTSWPPAVLPWEAVRYLNTSSPFIPQAHTLMIPI